MTNTIKELTERKSVRVFLDKEISPEVKAAILNAACQAPTAGNQQLYTIIDVTDEKLKERLVETCDDQPFIAQAKLVLVCRKLYADDLKENAFIDPDMLKHYAARDYHRFYICEITEVLVKEA